MDDRPTRQAVRLGLESFILLLNIRAAEDIR